MSLKSNKRVFFIVAIIILILLCSFLYTKTNHQRKPDPFELLSKAADELSEVKKRHIQHQKEILTDVQEFIGNITNYKKPSFEYESLRRKVVQNVQEFWYFINSQMTELKKKPNIEESTLFTANKVLSMGFEYKRALLNSMEKLTEADGFNDWRKNEISDLSNIVQTRLHYLQNPENCKNAKKLVCTIVYPCGFGCQMHYLICCMVVAYGLQRTLILESGSWQYHEGGWNKVFMPLSDNCTTIDTTVIDEWPGSNNSTVIRLQPTTDITPRSDYMPLAVPEDLINRLKAIHGDPIAWWIGQILKYIWKPNNITTAYINEKIKEYDIKSPIVGVHVRRTDKLYREAKYHAIEEYMANVDEYYNFIQIKTNITKRRVYIATDDFNVTTEAQTNYSHYEILYNRNIPKIPKTNPVHSNDNIYDVVLDIHILFHSDFLVCTFSSNICRLTYALMQTEYADASAKTVSIDSVYWYYQQKHNKRKVILSHTAQTAKEIDLIPGDIVDISEYSLNGYSFGRNLRTNNEGMWFWMSNASPSLLYGLSIWITKNLNIRIRRLAIS